MSNKEVFMHKSTYIDEGAKVGEGSKIWHNTHLTSTAVIGKNCIIGQNCYIAGVIKDGCKLQNNVNVYQMVVLNNYVFCGPNTTFTNDINPRAKYPKNGNWISTNVKEGASLGASCVILCGVTIGKWAFCGAGSVITHDVPDYGLVFGNPATLKGYICECGEGMPIEFTKFICKKCGLSYTKPIRSMKVKKIK